MPRVFIPSVPTRFDAVTQTRIPSMDLNPAADYGELVVMSEAGEEMESAIDRVYSLSQNVGKDDFLLAVGDIVLIAAAIAYISDNLGSARILRWDKHERKYHMVEVMI